MSFILKSKIRCQKYNNELYYAIVDIVEILTESNDPQAYWRKLKQRLREDKKRYKTDFTNRETMFRLIQ